MTPTPASIVKAMAESPLTVPKVSIATDNHGQSTFNRPIAIFSGM